MEHVWSATSKAGKIYIGDPCYVMKDAVYHGVWGDQHNFDNGEFDHDGVKFAIGGTAYGDGNYSGSNGTSFPVDAGVIGAVPSELLDEEKVAEYNERTFPGIMVDADEVILEYDDEGRFDFKTTRGVSIAFIDTIDPVDDYDDDYDDDALRRFKKYDDDDGEFPEVTEFINTVIPNKAAHSIAKELGIKNRDGVYQYGTKYNGFEMVENRETGEDYMFIGTKTALVDRILKQIDELVDGELDGELDESAKRFTASFRSGLREARAPKMKWYLMERDNPQLGTYWVKKGPFTRADAPGKSKSVYGGSTYHVFDTEEEYDAKIAELKASGERVRDF